MRTKEYLEDKCNRRDIAFPITPYKDAQTNQGGSSNCMVGQVAERPTQGETVCDGRLRADGLRTRSSSRQDDRNHGDSPQGVRGRLARNRTSVIHRKRHDNHPWSEQDKETIRVMFDQTYASECRIATLLNVTPNAVNHMVNRMGFRKIKRRSWTEKDEERLEELLSQYSIDEVARRTKRSMVAIVVKAKRMGISANHRSEWYTAQDAATVMGMNSSTVANRIKAGTLKASPHNSLHPPRKGISGAWHIHREDLKDYIQRHPEDLQGRNVDMILLVELLCGIKSAYH